MKHWLMKSEPATFGIEQLAAAPRRRTSWDGVRNFQARNMLRDEMQKGDLAFFYHSSCEVPGIYGIVKVVKAGYPDPTAFERGHAHYDPGSDRAAPRWFTVDVELVRRLAAPITLATLKAQAHEGHIDLAVLRKGNRLSITPVSAEQWRRVLGLA
jgi:predicted RNA-binding protein with PUA-like domain